MTSRALIPTMLLTLGALGGLAWAAPAKKTSGTPPATATCPKLTAEQCKADPRWSSAKYCASTPGTPAGMTGCAAIDPCQKAQLTSCKDVVLEALKNDPARPVKATTPVLKVGLQNIPKDLHKGYKRSSYSKPKKGRELNMVGKSVIARAGLTNPPARKLPPASAANAHRKPAWDTNGEKITSCQEFAYEELYDAMRYIDAVGACAGDRACEVEIAYLDTTPGIARRTLKRKDGKPIPQQLRLRDTGTMVKNDLFLTKSQIAYAIDPITDTTLGADGKRRHKRTAEMDALATVLDEGKAWYAFGCTSNCGPRKFKNEWGFHDKLRERNKLSKAEFAEYERRKAQYRELYEAWLAAASEGLARKRHNREELEKKKDKPLVSEVSRIDLVSADPFVRIDMMTKSLEAVEVLQAKGGGAKTGIPNAAQGAVGGAFRGNAPAAIGMLGMPAAAPAKRPASKAPKAGVLIPRCSPSNWLALGRDPIMDDLYFGGPAACALSTFLLEENARKAAGQKSCLDLDNDDCDWSPETFHGRFVASFPYAKALQSKEIYCDTWTHGSIKADNLASPRAKTKTKPEVVAAEDYIERMRVILTEAVPLLEPYKEGNVDVAVDGSKTKKKSMWKVGRDWEDQESFGDEDWFGAGYAYKVGWHVHPVRLGKQEDICALTGSAHGHFNIDATLLGNSIPVVDSDATFDTNKANKGESHLTASVLILGQQILPNGEAVDTKFATAWAPEEPLGGSMDLPPGWKPSITIMAGPVPVTGSVWGSVYYDAGLSASLKVPKTKGECTPKNVQFQMHGMVNPQIGVAGFAEVGAGIGGLLSAGIRGTVTLVSLGVPFNANLQVKSVAIDSKNQQQEALFNAGINLAVSTLSGYISLYIEILFIEDEWELFSWSGLSTEIALMDPALDTKLPLFGWPQ